MSLRSAMLSKVGAPIRGEMVTKYNRLLRIEEELGDCADFLGKYFLNNRFFDVDSRSYGAKLIRIGFFQREAFASILLSLGYSESEVEEFKKKKVI